MQPDVGNSSYPNVSPMTAWRNIEEHCPRPERCVNNEVSLESTLDLDYNYMNSKSIYNTDKYNASLRRCSGPAITELLLSLRSDIFYFRNKKKLSQMRTWWWYSQPQQIHGMLRYSFYNMMTNAQVSQFQLLKEMV